MPYEGEFAPYQSLRRITQSERVRELLGSFRMQKRQDLHDQTSSVLFQSIEPGAWRPSLVIAIDGSHIEVDIENGFPGAEASYITMACIFLDVQKMRRLDECRPVDPKEFRTTQQTESLDCALPGCNIVYSNELSAKDSLRRALFDELRLKQVFSDSETLLETYEALLKYKPSASREQKCPYDDCPITDGEYTRGLAAYSCQCQLRRPLYSTDALRVHEGMNVLGKNGAMFAEIMQVLERLWLIHVLRALEAKGWLSTLRRLAIVIDGPLAVFGHPAWLSQAISKELYRINDKAKQVNNGQDILLIGIEKTGAFATHLNYLDQHEAGSMGKIARQTVALISDNYIKTNVVPSESTKPYGADTYFGRKFFYKTRTGALIVGNAPFLEDAHRDTSKANPDQYPRLADTLALLDELFSSRYPNALAPLVAANAEAAIPLNLGKRVLEKLARELMAG